jgi:hypothetical protein
MGNALKTKKYICHHNALCYFPPNRNWRRTLIGLPAALPTGKKGEKLKRELTLLRKGE